MEQHPNKDRYERNVFDAFFDDALASRSALLALDRPGGTIIGSSGYCSWKPEKLSVARGYTFLVRDYWQKGYSRDMKDHMLRHAFRFAKTVIFHTSSVKTARKAV